MMKRSIFVAAALMLGGAVAPCFAYDGAGALRLRAPVTEAACDTRAEDTQGQCVSECDDKYIRARQFNMSDLTKVEADKKACDTKCGCPNGVK
jgi:hypothetical protein